MDRDDGCVGVRQLTMSPFPDRDASGSRPALRFRPPADVRGRGGFRTHGSRGQLRASRGEGRPHVSRWTASRAVVSHRNLTRELRRRSIVPAASQSRRIRPPTRPLSFNNPQLRLTRPSSRSSRPYRRAEDRRGRRGGHTGRPHRRRFHRGTHAGDMRVFRGATRVRSGRHHGRDPQAVPPAEALLAHGVLPAPARTPKLVAIFCDGSLWSLDGFDPTEAARGGGIGDGATRSRRLHAPTVWDKRLALRETRGRPWRSARRPTKRPAPGGAVVRLRRRRREGAPVRDDTWESRRRRQRIGQSADRSCRRRRRSRRVGSNVGSNVVRRYERTPVKLRGEPKKTPIVFVCAQGTDPRDTRVCAGYADGTCRVFDVLTGAVSAAFRSRLRRAPSGARRVRRRAPCASGSRRRVIRASVGNAGVNAKGATAAAIAVGDTSGRITLGRCAPGRCTAGRGVARARGNRDGGRGFGGLPGFGSDDFDDGSYPAENGSDATRATRRGGKTNRGGDGGRGAGAARGGRGVPTAPSSRCRPCRRTAGSSRSSDRSATRTPATTTQLARSAEHAGVDGGGRRRLVVLHSPRPGGVDSPFGAPRVPSLPRPRRARASRRIRRSSSSLPSRSGPSWTRGTNDGPNDERLKPGERRRRPRYRRRRPPHRRRRSPSSSPRARASFPRASSPPTRSRANSRRCGAWTSRRRRARRHPRGVARCSRWAATLFGPSTSRRGRGQDEDARAQGGRSRRRVERRRRGRRGAGGGGAGAGAGRGSSARRLEHSAAASAFLIASGPASDLVR